MHGSSHPPSTGSEPSSVLKLQSKDLEEILDLIDQLRSGGTDKYVDIPQIIVCGDQSSGKSSVLGALSEISFPWRDTVCTRFAIELILRRSKDANITVSIHPDDQRPSGEKKRLREFQTQNEGLEQFSDIVKSAEDHIDLGRTGQLFSKDVLRIEVSGPTQPHLTLVDLPGLYHAPDENQHAEGVQFVEDLVWSYMQKSRSIILAVVSAKSDIALQKVTSFTRKVDPKGQRTMGIITKPDTLSEDSEMEQSFLKLARNERLHLELGWHVLRNRNFEERDFSIAQRNDAESKFFARGVWSSLPRSQVGIDSLRPKLSVVLKNHILSQISGFAAEIRSSLAESESDLRKLGPARRNVFDQREYLLYGSERFSDLISDAINGNYLNPFFGDAMSAVGYQKRLRAVVQNRLLDFTKSMQDRGEHRRIVDDEHEIEEGENCVSRSNFAKEVIQRMRRSRGRELPGTFNPLVIGELFYLQAQPWGLIVDEYTELILEDTRQATMMMLNESLDTKSVEGLLNHVVNASFVSLEEKLRKKTEELLMPQQRGHPITYNQHFIENIQKARINYRRSFVAEQLEEFFDDEYPHDPSQKGKYSFIMNDLIDAIAADGESYVDSDADSDADSDMDKFSCFEAIDCMLAYYEVAHKKFVDDFSNLAIEKCLLEPLLKIYSPGTVQNLSDELVEDIALEDETTRLERERLEEKVKVLRMSIRKSSWLVQSSTQASAGPHTQTKNNDESTTFETGASGKQNLVVHAEKYPDSLVTHAEEDIPEDRETVDEWSISRASTKKKKTKQARIAVSELSD